MEWGWVCIIAWMEGVLGFGCCDRLHGRDGRICCSWLSVCVGWFCANEAAGSHEQPSPCRTAKDHFHSFCRTNSGPQKVGASPELPLFYSFTAPFVGPLEHSGQSEGPSAACSSGPLYCLPLPYISIWKVKQGSNSCLVKAPAEESPPPLFLSALTEYPFGSQWPIIHRKPFKQSLRWFGRESYWDQMQRFTTSSKVLIGQNLPADSPPRSQETEGGTAQLARQCDIPPSLHTESFMNSNCIPLISCFWKLPKMQGNNSYAQMNVFLLRSSSSGSFPSEIFHVGQQHSIQNMGYFLQ